MGSSNVIVIIGCGGMGLPVARSLGIGRQILLADFADTSLASAKTMLTGEGYSVSTAQVDVSNFDSVSKLATTASSIGHIEAIVHTAGAPPTGNSTRRIFETNLLGTANAIDAFISVAKHGTSLVVVSSMAGYLGPALEPELERHLATAPRDQLLSHSAIEIENSDASGPPKAYGLSKRGNLLRVQAAAADWGRVGARVNSVSPGVISTEMGRQEITSGSAVKFVLSSPAGRVGTPQDIVNAVVFLASPASSFIIGNDILVDGGVVASLKWPKPEVETNK
ncbi:hypothetical protein EDB81DRAFT_906599 [Dactylonectria macrodidyma]|uniref:NAD(P)-binding protein n=1 Tax=Dactylonectria macrodidyma TaxID=307937 RepID=A0A9P9E1A0_9HYPO|nr:hypothetical protein EDB81DRAFT_906599 [Dactylonectria macrodidyma]